MQKPLTLGIAGLGTVGAGLLELLAHAQGAASPSSAGRPIAGRRRVARARKRQGPRRRHRPASRGSTIRSRWRADPSIDVFVELIGGVGRRRQGRGRGGARGRQARRHRQQGAARQARRRARQARRGEGRRAQLRGGGRRRHPRHQDAARRRSAANEVRRVYGILNGTCNYILTKMQDEHRSFADVLKEAQDTGLRRGRSDLRHRRLRHRAQARHADEPRLRHRASHFDADPRRGHPVDHARPTSRRPRTSATASSCSASRRGPRAASRRACIPAMVPQALGHRRGVGRHQRVAIDGDFCGNLLLVGPGAGGRATASAVASDILDIARGAVMPPLRHTARAT